MAWRAGLVALAACGRPYTTYALSDTASLIQSRNVVPPLSQAQLAEVKLRWPDIGHLLDEMQDSMRNVTDRVGEVVEDANEKVEAMEQAAQDFADSLGQRVADVLNHVLSYAKAEAAKLLNHTRAQKREFFLMLNQSIARANGTILPDFEKGSHTFVSVIVDMWETFRLLVDHSAETIERGLRSSGQDALADEVKGFSDRSIDSLDGFMAQLKYFDEDLHSVGERDAHVAQEALVRANDELGGALERVDDFVRYYEDLFREVAEKIGQALTTGISEEPNVTTGVDAAFASVQQNVSEVAWRVRSCGREVTVGLHKAIVKVAKANGHEAPLWHGGSAAAARWPLVALLAALVAGLASTATD